MNDYNLKLQNDRHIKDMYRERDNDRLAKQIRSQRHMPVRPRLITLILVLLGKI